MSSLRVLITGGSGLLGQYLNVVLSRSYEILTLYNDNTGNCQDFNSARLDILDYRCLTGAFQAFRPEAVVHTAAVSNSEKAARLPESKVLAVNVEATKTIAALCNKFNSKMIYTSTDLVYDGSRGVMLKEDAFLNPVTLYAETKLLGEEALKAETGDYIILRTALLYGMGLGRTRCHFQEMYGCLKEGKPVRLFYDQYRSPLSLRDAASVISGLIGKDIPSQVINFGGRERISRYGLGSILCEEAGISKSLLRAISMEEVLKSSGVKDVSMDTSKLSQLDIERRTIRESVRESLIS